MDSKEIRTLCAGLEQVGSIEELEHRLECTTCIEIDECFIQYCWQFAAGYGRSTECVVQCEPHNGCDPYCYD